MFIYLQVEIYTCKQRYCETMMKKNMKIWIWIQNNRLLKAISNQDTGTLTIYDEWDNILLKRTGLTRQQVKKIEIYLSNQQAKRIDDHREPFTYL